MRVKLAKVGVWWGVQSRVEAPQEGELDQGMSFLI